MIPIKPPAMDALTHYQVCTETTRPLLKRWRLGKSQVSFLKARENYETLAKAHNLHVYRDLLEPTASSSELVALYESQMARKGSVGRAVYDSILQSAAQGRCPYCSIGAALSVDHYLPKESFPILSVLTLNLVPSCSDCNHNKLRFLPTVRDEQFFHPYFDGIVKEPWLFARVVFDGKDPRVEYYTDEVIKKSIVRRLAFQFKMLKLGKLFASNAGAEITEKKYHLRKVLAKRGRKGVRSYLLGEAESSAALSANSWRALAYGALASSEEFCGGAFGA